MKPLAAALLLTAADALACPGLEVREAWIREAPPGAMMTAGYAQLANRGSRPLSLEGAVSADFGGAELHRSVLVGGVAKMIQEPLRLAPGTTGTLEPGGWHLMLFRPARTLKAGDRVQLSLQCGAESQKVTFIVRSMQ